MCKNHVHFLFLLFNNYWYIPSIYAWSDQCSSLDIFIFQFLHWLSITGVQLLLGPELLMAISLDMISAHANPLMRFMTVIKLQFKVRKQKEACQYLQVHCSFSCSDPSDNEY
jgi:hypothetical protein